MPGLGDRPGCRPPQPTQHPEECHFGRLLVRYHALEPLVSVFPLGEDSSGDAVSACAWLVLAHSCMRDYP